MDGWMNEWMGLDVYARVHEGIVDNKVRHIHLVATVEFVCLYVCTSMDPACASPSTVHGREDTAPTVPFLIREA